MEATQWSEAICLGVEAIDTDHRQLVSDFNQVSAACTPGVEPAVFNDALGKLVDHTAAHFRREEALMKSCGYHAIDVHHLEHEVLLSSVTMLRKKSAQEKDKPMNSYALTFLWSWLVDHIDGADRAFADFLLQRPSGGAQDAGNAARLRAQG